MSHLPNLNYLDLSGCSIQTGLGFLPHFSSLETLLLVGVRINESDVTFITELRTLYSLSLSKGSFDQLGTVNRLFSNQLSTLTSFSFYHVDSIFCGEFVRVVNESKLPNLVKLRLSIGDESDMESLINDVCYVGSHCKISYQLFQHHQECKATFRELQAEKLPHLKSLTLTGLLNVYHQYDGLRQFSTRVKNLNRQGLEDIAEKVVKWGLASLNLSFNRGLSENLWALLCHTFLSLETLRLHDCDLTPYDMHDLADARQQGRLPKLKFLDVSGNSKGDHDMWNETWKDVIQLDDQ